MSSHLQGTGLSSGSIGNAESDVADGRDEEVVDVGLAGEEVTESGC